MSQIIFPTNLFNSVKRWAAFKGKYPPGSDKEHIIIIVCIEGEIAKYLFVTSQVEKARKIMKKDIGALVDKIDGNHWGELTKESCIQCNKAHLHETSVASIKQAHKTNKIKYLGEVPEGIRKSIISAVCASSSFDAEEKTALTV